MSARMFNEQRAATRAPITANEQTAPVVPQKLSSSRQTFSLLFVWLQLLLLSSVSHAWAGAASPSGGEPFVMQGGVLLTAEQVAHLIALPQNACQPQPPLSGSISPGLQYASPAPSVSWRASSCNKGRPADAQIAVSSSRVVVTFENSMAWYDKAGTKQGELTAFDLFGTLISQLAPISGPVGTCAGISPETCAQTQSDMRVLFDAHRGRFWLLSTAGIYSTNYDSSKDCASQSAGAWCRGIDLLAVSQTDDPKDGWYLFWWDAVAHFSASAGRYSYPYERGDGADYPSIGIDNYGFYQTNPVANASAPNTTKYTHVVLFPADQPVAGIRAVGWHYFDLQDPDGSAATNIIQPAVHHGLNDRTFFVSRSVAEADGIVVWAATGLLQGKPAMERVEVKLVDQNGKSTPFQIPPDAPELGGKAKIAMSNLLTHILKAVYRTGLLIFTANDTVNGDFVSTVRLVQLQVLGFPNILTVGDPVYLNSRSFANSPTSVCAFPLTACDNAVFSGWSAVEVNKNYDLAVVYASSGPSMYPQVRYNAYFHNQSFIRTGRILKWGEAAYSPNGCGVKNGNLVACRWGDTAGAAVDPVDNTGIWLAQQYANLSHSWDIWVARVF